MNALVSPFASALLVKVTLLFASGFAILAVGRRAAAELRHVALFTVLASALVLPVALRVLPAWDAAILPSPAAVAAPASQFDAGEVTVPHVTVREDAVRELHSTGGIAASGTVVVRPSTTPVRARVRAGLMLWFTGLLAVLCYIVVGDLKLRRIAGRAVPLVGDQWHALLNKERGLADVTRPVTLLVSPAAASPMTWGLRRPIIMLPEDALEWNHERRRVVLRHELAHVARGDAMAQFVANIVCAVYWFHPLAWLMARRLRVECERACDDRVLSTGVAADRYASHLLDVARATRSMGGPGFVSLAMVRTSHLEDRLRGVLDGAQQRLVLSRIVRDGVVLSASAIVLAFSACRAVTRGGSGEPVVGVRTVANGVTTVQHSADAFAKAPQLTLDTTPMAVMRGESGAEDDLRWSWQAIVLSDGRYAILRVINPAVLVFSPDGVPARHIGTLGNGPGQFMNAFGMYQMSGDTLVVPDQPNGRVNWIHPDTGFVRSEVLAPIPRELSGTGIPNMLPDGRVVSTREAWPGDSMPGLRPFMIPLAVGNLNFSGTRRFDSIPGRDLIGIETHYRAKPRRQPMPLQLGRVHYETVWDSVIAVAAGAHGYEVESHDTSGHIVSRLRVDIPRRPVTAAMREAEIARQLKPYPGKTDKRFTEMPINMQETMRLMRETPFADSLPSTRMIFATKAKNLWVVDGASPLDTGWTATAFRRDGAIIARLHSPYGKEPMYMGDDRIIVNVSDSAGTHSLRVYRLSKPLTATMRSGSP